jgi:hypothetical protein
MLSGLLAAAQRRGDIPGDVDVNEAGDVLSVVLIRAILESVEKTAHEPLQKLLERRARLVLYGVVPQPAPA